MIVTERLNAIDYFIQAMNCYSNGDSKGYDSYVAKMRYSGARAYELRQAFYNITPTVKVPTRFEMFQINIKFFKAVFGFIVVGVISMGYKGEVILSGTRIYES